MLWNKNLDREQGFCVVGDLIFGVVNAYDLVAWDRYTGEQVWQADGKYDGYGVKASGNKVFFNSLQGTIRCYEWDEVYKSPAKF